MDFHACRWPPHIPSSHDTSIAEYFDNLNEPALSNLAENLEMEEEQTGQRPPLITFSHFLPLQVTALSSCAFLLAHAETTMPSPGCFSTDSAPSLVDALTCGNVNRHGNVSHCTHPPQLWT